MCFPSAGTGSIPRWTQTILPKARSARRSAQDPASLLLLFQPFPVCQVRPQMSCNQRGPTCTYGLGIAHEALARAHPTVSMRLKFHGGRSRIAQLYVQNTSDVLCQAMPELRAAPTSIAAPRSHLAVTPSAKEQHRATAAPSHLFSHRRIFDLDSCQGISDRI
ncbi:hypothetical protein PHLGIDRAFT_255425 [Phlebiopsis gigantea 11061_1 CR5-6]|uniref:Uncharacterized protein n=1 Tax=Phlebiopsis gigantea (strain 11061_1 CR5-6) TaxID=745531 RepID=A0A0C3S4Q2_PHLG1|nr:hypothetical protein PHLGIDRAFT_255425 [Phlebiopsis gigantea 11061_1 CR5-6]